MALVKEDGTGLNNANSYTDKAFGDAFYADRGVPVTWSGAAEAAIEEALIKATDFMELRWGPRLRGIKATDDQALEVPRDGILDNSGVSLEDSVPVQMQKACVLYATLILGGTSLLPSAPTTDPDSIRRTVDKVGPITIEVEYEPSRSSGNLPEYTEADMYMKQLIRNRSGAVRH